MNNEKLTKTELRTSIIAAGELFFGGAELILALSQSLANYDSSPPVTAVAVVLGLVSICDGARRGILVPALHIITDVQTKSDAIRNQTVADSTGLSQADEF